MQKTHVILVGGFLGAGKTTLIAAATQQLAEQGKRVGIVTNDQAANLVDTATLQRPGMAIQEVSGGCFCCRFDDLVTKLRRLAEDAMPDVLIGEPVGSCTDLSATVLQPMKKLLADSFHLTPFTVVVDATQLKQTLAAGQSRFPENVTYIYRKQLEEADLIVVNKVDRVDGDELTEIRNLLARQFPQALVVTLSALERTGVDVWLSHVLNGNEAGRTITEVDYDIYADGEAALGWLNASVGLQSEKPLDGRELCRNLMESIRGRLRQAAAEIAHLKLHLAAGNGVVTANLTNNQEAVALRGQSDGSEARLLVNVRAKIDPAPLRAITEECLEALADGTLRLTIEEIDSFAPGRPQPTHRFEKVL